MHAIALVPVLFGLPSLCGLINTQFPHLIVPISKLAADTPLNTGKSFDIERDIYTEFLFDVPQNDASFCRLRLTINVEPSKNVPWHLWGPTGNANDPFIFNVSSLASSINKDADTWNKHPAIKETVAQFRLYKNGFVEQKGGDRLACAKGTIAEFLAHPADATAEGGLTWFELSDPLHGLTYEGWVDAPVKPSGVSVVEIKSTLTPAVKATVASAV